MQKNPFTTDSECIMVRGKSKDPKKAACVSQYSTSEHRAPHMQI
jgi:hypothetical protein